MLDRATRAHYRDAPFPRISIYEADVFCRASAAAVSDRHGLLSCPFPAIDGMLSLRNPTDRLSECGYLLRPVWEVLADPGALEALGTGGHAGHVFDLVVPRALDGPLPLLDEMADLARVQSGASLDRQLDELQALVPRGAFDLVSGDGFPEYHFDFRCELRDADAAARCRTEITGYWNTYTHRGELEAAAPSIAENHISVFGELSDLTGEIELGQTRQLDVEAMIHDPSWAVIAHHEQGEVDFSAFLIMDLLDVDWFDPAAIEGRLGFNVEYISTTPDFRGAGLAYDAMRLGAAFLPHQLGLGSPFHVMFNTPSTTVDLVPSMAADAIQSSGHSITGCRVDTIYRALLQIG